MTSAWLSTISMRCEGDALETDVARHLDARQRAQFGFDDFIERTRLGDRPWKPVEQEPLLRVWLREPLGHHARDDLVVNQAAGFHDRRDFAAERGACLDCLAEHRAGGNVRNVPSFAQLACLRALAGARRAEHHQVKFHSALKLYIRAL